MGAVISKQGDVLRALGKGDVLTVSYINEPPSSAKKSYKIADKTVRGDLVQRMLRDGLIKPNADSFDFGEAQTYVRAEVDGD